MGRHKIKIFDVVNTAIMLTLMLVAVYPFVYVVFASFSDPWELVKHKGFLWKPLGFTIEGSTLLTVPILFPPSLILCLLCFLKAFFSAPAVPRPALALRHAVLVLIAAS